MISIQQTRICCTNNLLYLTRITSSMYKTMHIQYTCTELIKLLRVKMFAQSCFVDLQSKTPCVSISNMATFKTKPKIVNVYI